MSPTADLKINMWVRQPQVFKKIGKHVLVIMLPGMDDNRVRPILPAQGVVKGAIFIKFGLAAETRCIVFIAL